MKRLLVFDVKPEAYANAAREVGVETGEIRFVAADVGRA